MIKTYGKWLVEYEWYNVKLIPDLNLLNYVDTDFESRLSNNNS